MPAKSGLSHAVGATLVLIASPVVERLVGSLFERYEPLDAIGRLGGELALPWMTSIDDGLTTAIFTGVALVSAAFVWGVGYHLTRHGADTDPPERDYRF